MSQDTRNRVAQNAILRADVDRHDLVTPAEDGGTDTNLIAVLDALERAGWYVEITSLRHTHSDDSSCGPDCHERGKACDLWFNGSRASGDYLDPGSEAFAAGIAFLASLPEVVQIGLGGSAMTPITMEAAGSKGFEDNGSDHVHFGV